MFYNFSLAIETSFLAPHFLFARTVSPSPSVYWNALKCYSQIRFFFFVSFRLHAAVSGKSILIFIRRENDLLFTWFIGW